MKRTKSDTRPFYAVMHEYQASLKEYTEAAMMLHVAVTTALHLVSQGADPAKAMETIRDHDHRFDKAAHGISTEAK